MIRLPVALGITAILLSVFGGGWLVTFWIVVVAFSVGRLVEAFLGAARRGSWVPDVRHVEIWLPALLAVVASVGLAMSPGTDVATTTSTTITTTTTQGAPRPDPPWRVEVRPNGQLLGVEWTGNVADLEVPAGVVSAEVWASDPTVPYADVVDAVEALRGVGVSEIEIVSPP